MQKVVISTNGVVLNPAHIVKLEVTGAAPNVQITAELVTGTTTALGVFADTAAAQARLDQVVGYLVDVGQPLQVL